jgi:hypothetical protein
MILIFHLVAKKIMKIKKLIIISVTSELVEQPINIVDKTPIAKPMTKGVEVNVDHDSS